MAPLAKCLQYPDRFKTGVVHSKTAGLNSKMAYHRCKAIILPTTYILVPMPAEADADTASAQLRRLRGCTLAFLSHLTQALHTRLSTRG